MSKNRGQSNARAIRRGNRDARGVSLKRPFNNRKRTLGREAQVQSEKYYNFLKRKLLKLRKDYNEKLIEEQIKKLDEGISNN